MAEAWRAGIAQATEATRLNTFPQPDSIYVFRDLAAGQSHGVIVHRDDALDDGRVAELNLLPVEADPVSGASFALDGEPQDPSGRRIRIRGHQRSVDPAENCGSGPDPAQ